ncbi:cytochrome P450 [Pseudoruegeria sp. HB172150]|uniref:cytochrome P450 n=1 Tax=Pseudoruegeria sp. HB172150 TaxID=2721164 RepID=UPI00352DA996
MSALPRVSQSPTDPGFVQDPYPFYDRVRALGPLVFWEEYKMPVAAGAAEVNALLRDRRLGREVPPEMAPEIPARLAPFYDIEAHSMLELEPPRHKRLRSLVLRAFTSRRIASMGPEIEALCHDLVDAFPEGDFDLLPAYCTQIPVIVIARLLGVPEAMAPDLLRWSNDMVAMYQARRDRAVEDRAMAASAEFSAFMRDYVERRRADPRDDLITELIAAEEAGERLSTDELITTCILLLNAGHEATVHTMGNGVKALLEAGVRPEWLSSRGIEGTVEEVLRFDAPLHMFTRYVYEDVELFGHALMRGDQVACLLGAANRDPAFFEDPGRFDPLRPVKPNASFGAGIHFCVGAPLARLELQIALPVLFSRLPDLRLAEQPRYADLYHFHGLERLMVRG